MAIARLFFCLLLLPTLLAQDTPPSVNERLRVRMVNMEVSVKDRDGNPVTNLSREDFRVFVDGAPVDVAYFEEFWNPPSGPQGLQTRALDRQPNAFEERDLEALRPRNASREGNAYLVFFDDFFTLPKFRPTLLKNLSANLNALQPGDTMTIVRFAGNDLEMMVPWGGDKQALRSGIHQLKQKRSGFPRRELAAEEDGRAYFIQVAKISSAISGAMRALKPDQGRRVLMLMSSGWAVNELETRAFTMGLNINDGGQELRSRRGSVTEVENGFLQYERMVETASLLGYTAYPVQGWLDGSMRDDVTMAALAAPGADIWDVSDSMSSDALGGVGVIEGTNDAFALPSGKYAQFESLYRLARDTGGDVIARGLLETQPIGTVQKRTRSYYRIGFMASTMDTSRRKITIEIKGDSGNYKLTHKNHIRMLNESDQAARVTESALFSKYNDTALRAELGAIKHGRRMTVPLTLQIPLQWVALGKLNNSNTVPLELHTVCRDAYGGTSNTITTPIPWTLAEGRNEGTLPFQVTFTLGKNTRRVTLTLLNKGSGETLTRTLDLPGRSQRKSNRKRPGRN